MHRTRETQSDVTLRAISVSPLTLRDDAIALSRDVQNNKPNTTKHIGELRVKFRSILALGTAMLAATVVVVAVAQGADERAPFWPAITDTVVVDEFYSDLPWHQKLGTYAGNQIDEAIIMPYAALPQTDRTFCANQGWSKQEERARCMIEIGVANILGMQRIDTLYKKEGAIKDAPECKDTSLPCIEVMLRVSNFYGMSGENRVKLARRVFGNGQATGPTGIYYGYTLSDGTTYAPQMPWYMSHYCDGMFKSGTDFNDPACYGDYLSTFNSGFNAWGQDATGWPRSVPWSVWPAQALGQNVCRENEMACNIVLAGFDLKAVPPAFTKDLQYSDNNDLLLQWFNNALSNFKSDQGVAENQRHFPWNGKSVTWDDFYLPSAQNPFLGTFPFTAPLGQGTVDCYTTLTGPQTKAGQDCAGQTLIVRASQTLYPRQCSLTDLASGNATNLRQCGLNYELHHNGWITQWPTTQSDDWTSAITAASMISNQYGRTSFLFAGVPGMQLPVSFYQDPGSPSGLSIYEQVYNTSIFSLYIPIANEADTKRAMPNRQYQDDFYHTLLMSNHMEADPDVFADGIRGKTLWHNEYRVQGMYQTFRNNPAQSRFPDEMFPAAFDGSAAKVPFHNNTCDGCHVRNGSGVPINTLNTLDARLQEFMTDKPYNPYNPVKDYTFTGQIRPMKLVFFDLRRATLRTNASHYSEPLAFTPLTLAQPPRTAQLTDLYYNNAIMNFYGDSFHVTTPGNSYKWSYGPASAESLVVGMERKNPELNKTYTPWQVNVSSFTTSADQGNCQIVLPGPAGEPWPTSCDDVNGETIGNAIKTQAVGYMLLNGKRLGNSSAIEAMPNDAIKSFRDSQKTLLGDAIAGELIWTVGSRDGVDGTVKRNCITNSTTDCFIGRFGWLGDRASLEDQVANAAFVEMNMTSSEGYKKLYPTGKATSPIRYLVPNCGPANKACVSASGNRDLSERDIERMADYARWVGNPTRSEFQVTLPEVVAGERVFRNLKCDTCHVIKRIDITPGNTMLAAAYRDRLAKRVGVDKNNGKAIKPFLSYLGTDLLMHDMGYLSQVGIVPAGTRFRDPSTGVVYPEYQNYVQKIRTPALKGMRLNRFVTESYKNTKNPYDPTKPNDPACDFLMHDGRACDAVEAAFLHDGPAIKKLGVVDALTKLSPSDVTNLRAFLYSL